MLQQYSGSAILAHFDPRYVVAVEVLAAYPDASPFTAGKRIAIAIHSPAQVFSAAAETLAGRTLDFAITRNMTADGELSYSDLTTKSPE